MASKSQARLTTWMTGVAEADELLKDLEKSMVMKLVRAATRKIAKRVAQHAKAHVPRLTGALATSIKVRAMQTVKRGQFKTTGDKNTKKVGASVRVGGGFFRGETFYGGFLEFGTVDRFHKGEKYRGTDSLGRHRWLRAKGTKYVGKIEKDKYAYIRPAAEANRQYTRDEFATAIRESITEAAQKATKKKAKALPK